MEFFNFWNAETFHVFQWAANCKSLNLEAMIAAAFGAVKPDDLTINDVCEAARDNLANALQDLVEAQAGYILGQCGGIEEIDMWGIAEVPEGDASSLIFPILAQGMNNIDYAVVAKAFLIRAGKWHPDTATPDAL